MTTSLLDRCLALALEYLPRHPQFRHYLHYAFVAQGNRLVEWGTNLNGEPPVYFGYHAKSQTPKLHAELVAFRKARGLLAGAPFDMVNVRLNRLGQTKVSAPCRICQEWLQSVGCQTVWFTTSTARFGKVRL